MRIWNALMVSAALLTGPRPAQDDARAERTDAPPTLTVHGDAEVAAEPDRAVVTLGATAQASAAAAAQQQVSVVMDRAITAVREAGVPDEAIQTARITLSPVYSNPRRNPSQDEDQTPRIVAYRASNSIRVQVDDPVLIGKVIDLGIAAGANELEGVSFELRDDTPQRSEALRQAVGNARTKAEALAGAADVRLVAVHRIEERGVETLPFVQMRAQAMSFDAGTPVRPGEVRVRASVTLAYRIAPLAAEPSPGEGR